MTEDGNLSLEDEFMARVAAAKKVLAQIESFAQSLALYVGKLYDDDGDGYDADTNKELFIFIKGEAARTLKSIEDFCLSTKGSLLLISQDIPCLRIMKAISQLREPELEYYLFSLSHARDNDRIREICEDVLTDLQQLRQTLPMIKEEIEQLFHQQKARYSADNQQELDTYRHDIKDRSESLRALIEEYKDNPVINCWKQHHHDVFSTIEAMREEGYTELDLITLLRYLVRYDIVCEVVAEPIIAKVEEDRIKALKEYLIQLQPLCTETYRESFERLIDDLLNDTDVREWLLYTVHCKFKEYNKIRVFKMARHLKNRGVLSYNQDIELNPILEGSVKDTSCRKSMNNNDIKEEKTETIITEIVRKMTKNI